MAPFLATYLVGAPALPLGGGMPARMPAQHAESVRHVAVDPDISESIGNSFPGQSTSRLAGTSESAWTCRVGRAPPRGGVQAGTACGGVQPGTPCCAPRDLLRAWQCRGTACRARSSRSSTWLLNIRSRTDETDRSTTDGGYRGFDGRHCGFKFHPLLRQTLDPYAVVLDGSSHMLPCKKDFWL